MPYKYKKKSHSSKKQHHEIASKIPYIVNDVERAREGMSGLWVREWERAACFENCINNFFNVILMGKICMCVCVCASIEKFESRKKSFFFVIKSKTIDLFIELARSHHFWMRILQYCTIIRERFFRSPLDMVKLHLLCNQVDVWDLFTSFFYTPLSTPSSISKQPTHIMCERGLTADGQYLVVVVVRVCCIKTMFANNNFLYFYFHFIISICAFIATQLTHSTACK